MIRGFLARGVDVADPKLKAVDLQYSDIDPAKSLYHALVRKGRMRTLVEQETIEDAADTPPADSRAWFRGTLSTKFSEEVLASNWQAVVLRSAAGPRRVQIDAVDGFTEAEVGEIVAGSATVDELLAALG